MVWGDCGLHGREGLVVDSSWQEYKYYYLLLENQEVEQGLHTGPSYKPQGLPSTDLLPLARPHLKLSQLPQTVLPARDQVLKHVSL